MEEKVEQCRKRKVPSENEPQTNKKQKYDKKVVLEREGNKTSKDGVFPEAKCGKNSVDEREDPLLRQKWVYCT